MLHCILVRNLLSNLFQAAIDKGDSETMAALMAGQYVDTALDAPALRVLVIQLHVEGTRVRSLEEVPDEEIRRAFQAECQNMKKHNVLAARLATCAGNLPSRCR